MVKSSKKQKIELNIMEHQLVPYHKILSDKEKKELLEKLNITPDQLPKIINNDPVAKNIGAQPGQIIKIIRKSHTAKLAEAYRFVIESNK
jgi:DNA-directed RNA polymerase subunit H